MEERTGRKRKRSRPSGLQTNEPSSPELLISDGENGESIAQDNFDTTRQLRTEELLKIIFDEILKALADMDWFASKTSPSIFLVYAHNNPRVGEANSATARQLIEWLVAIRAKVLSDQSPVFDLCYTRDEGNAAAHDILSNQFCLLPIRGQASHVDKITSVDKVLLCCSEVLQSYHEDDRMKQYTQDIKKAYYRTQREPQEPEVIKNEIRQVVKEYRDMDSFHHVITELAFLDIRSSEEKHCHSIIPIVFNGDGIRSFPYFDKGEPGWLKVQSSQKMVHPCQTVHKLFFNTLRRIYEDRYQQISQFESYYETCIEGLPLGNQYSQEQFREYIHVELLKTLDNLKRHAIAYIRGRPEISSSQNTYLNTLAFQEMNYREQEIREAHADSATWITNHPSYIEWIKRGNGILGVRGKPGSGKSTIMKRIFHLLSSKDGSYVQLAFFYHRRGTAIQHSQIGMYRTLLYQLLREIPSAGTEFWKLAEEKEKFQGKPGVDWEWRIEEVQQALSTALLLASKIRKLRIFVDALDEGGSKVAQEVVLYFREINERLLQSHAHVSICFSCRHFPVIHVKEGFEVYVEDHNQKDISRYLTSELKQRLDFKDRLDEEEMALETLQSQVLESASGVFLWVALVIPLIAEEWNSGGSLRETQQMLRSIPSNLDEIYQHILSNVVNRSKLPQSLHLMQWILLAERPLLVTELRFAIALDDTSLVPGIHTYLDSKSFIESDGRMKTLINSLTGGLAEVKLHSEKYGKQTGTVQFIHQSVNDFLFKDRFKCLQPDLSVDAIGLGHDRLARSCINYIKLEGVRWETMKRNKLWRVPFCEYTIKFCFSHAEKAESCGVLQTGLVTQFEWPSYGAFRIWRNIHEHIYQYKENRLGKGATFLHVASTWNLNSLVTELLRRDVNIEEPDEESNTAMHCAARWGCKSIIKILLNAGALASPKNMKEETPLSKAAGAGHESIVKLLLDLGEDINTQTGSSGNALQSAAFAGRASVVRLLIQMGAHINAQVGEYGNALQAAAITGSEVVVRLLLQAGANVNARGGVYGNALQAAITKGSGSEVVKLLLEAGAYVNAQDEHYGNALQAAAAAVHYSGSEVVKLLLEAGANVNAQGGHYGNALQAAAAASANDGGLEVVKLLLEAGANVNAQGGYYGNALQVAAFQGLEVVVPLLLQGGADVNVQGGKYGNALVAALSHGYRKIEAEALVMVQILLAAGADVNAQGGEHGTALPMAKARRWTKVVQVLLSAGAKSPI